MAGHHGYHLGITRAIAGETMSSHSFHQLYYHVTWSTKHRMPLIEERVHDWLLACIADECPKRQALLIACNAMPDHVHLLVSLPPTECVAAFIGQIKGASSRLFKRTHGVEDINLVWQEGYGVVTLRKGELPKAIDYVNKQQEIHAARKASKILETMWV
jgi:putative transposase